MKLVTKDYSGYKVWLTGNKPFCGIHVVPNLIKPGQSDKKMVSRIKRRIDKWYTIYISSLEEFSEVSNILRSHGISNENNIMEFKKDAKGYLPEKRVKLNESDIVDKGIIMSMGFDVMITDDLAGNFCKAIKDLKQLEYKFWVGNLDYCLYI